MVGGGSTEAPALDELADFLTAARQLSRCLNAVLAEDDLREDLWRVMHHLGDFPGAQMGALAEALVLPNATVTRLINELIDLGLVYRKPGLDRRVAVAYLSRNGVDRLTRVSSLLSNRLRTSLPSVPPAAEALMACQDDDAAGALI